jgi:hypothetical protein
MAQGEPVSTPLTTTKQAPEQNELSPHKFVPNACEFPVFVKANNLVADRIKILLHYEKKLPFTFKYHLQTVLSPLSSAD